MKLYPVILTESLSQVQKQIDLVKNNELIKGVQIDILDGTMADNMTVTPLDLEEIDFGNLFVDFHILTEEPMDYVWEMIEIKKRLPIRAVISQIERMSYPDQYLDELAVHQWKKGISLELYTPLEAIEGDLLADLDIIQLMAVPIGFQGQKLDNRIFERLEKLNEMINNQNLSIEIMVDGGIKLSNRNKLIQAGASSLVVGSELWKSNDITKYVQEFIKN